MKVLASAGDEDVAMVYVAEVRDRQIEFVESVQPPLPRDEKWVLMVSTLFGCPVGCPICDAGGHYGGKLTADEILEQIDHLVQHRYPDGRIPASKFKIQFARMGEPALNDAVIDVLKALPGRYDAPGLIPSVSTVAPKGSDAFFERLMDVKNELYPNGRFQLQFSVHTTDEEHRDHLVPVLKWGLDEIGDYGKRFVHPGDRKITLNFALAEGSPIDPEVLLDHLDPEFFLIKITPVNPTHRAVENKMDSYVDPSREEGYDVVEALENAGYEVILSIGETEENRIGSNCGMYVQNHLKAASEVPGAYVYELQSS